MFSKLMQIWWYYNYAQSYMSRICNTLACIYVCMWMCDIMLQWEDIYKKLCTKCLRVADEIIVRLLCIGSNKDVGTKLLVESLNHLNELRVEQISSSLELSWALPIRPSSHGQFCRNAAQWPRSCHQNPPRSEVVQLLKSNILIRATTFHNSSSLIILTTQSCLVFFLFDH